MAHNHVTRDIKPKGQCPGCDTYWVTAHLSDEEVARFNSIRGQIPESPASAANEKAWRRQNIRPIADPEDHALWCKGGHEGPCRRGRAAGTEA